MTGERVAVGHRYGDGAVGKVHRGSGGIAGRRVGHKRGAAGERVGHYQGPQRRDVSLAAGDDALVAKAGQRQAAGGATAVQQVEALDSEGSKAIFATYCLKRPIHPLGIGKGLAAVGSGGVLPRLRGRGTVFFFQLADIDIDELRSKACRNSCLALARLSDEGIISGCEGDIPSLWSLMVAHALTGRPAFMANPSSSNPADATVDFAHCTIPISMTSSYTLPSHFESGIGIGIAGILAEGPCKILKIGGPLLDKAFRAEGCIVCNTRIPERCRTQIRFQFPSRADFARFMSNRLGNHIVLYR